MVETEITILINRKSDIELIRKIVIDRKIQFPIYILEFENSYQLNLVSDYEELELESSILDSFPDYEFTSNLDRGRKEIRLQLSRYQSELSFDNWGRPIEDPLNETKYLIKKSNNKPERFNPKIRVLFENNVQDYFINIVNGVNKTTGEKGFLLLNEFKTKNEECKAEVLKDILYKSPHEAFNSGYYKMQELVNKDFKDYTDNKKKEIRNQQKLPRKIIREFINSCNKLDNEGILRNLDEAIVFEKRVNWQKEVRIEGIKEFKEYIKSPNQDLCTKEFRIRSSWDFNSSSVTIGIKYYPALTQNEEKNNIEQYGRITFILKNGKIISISKEN